MKTLSEYAQLVKDNKGNPREIADLQLEMSAKYAMISDIAKDLIIEKAIFTNDIKFAGEKPLSDSAVDAKWYITEGGQKEIRLKYELKALEKLLAACKSYIVVMSNEAKNAW